MTALPLLFAIALAGADGAAQIAVETIEGQPRFVAQLPEGAREQVRTGVLSQTEGETILRLQLKKADGKLGPNIFSRYESRQGKITLTPRFGLVAGETYLVRLFIGGRARVTREYRTPVAHTGDSPSIKRIYPTVDTLPANHLKFYIHFSQPMREGRAIFDQIRLRDSAGKLVHNPWRRQELWNADATRLTLWVHPGRVKTGVNLRDDEGPVLQPGEYYTLEFTGELKGQDGQPLKEFRKEFTATKDDRRRPLPSNWKISVVRAGTRQPLRIAFGEPLDAALAARGLRIYGPDGKRTPGTIGLEEGQSLWKFVPTINWEDDGYRILVSEDLEDLAGNTPQRLFDTDLRKAALKPAVLDLGFRPQKAD